MDYKKIYEKVNFVTKITERAFLNYIDDSITELEAVHGKFLYEEGTHYKAPHALSDPLPVRKLYHGVLADNVLFLAGAGEHHKSEALRKARLAYNKYWHDNAKGRRIRRVGW